MLVLLAEMYTALKSYYSTISFLDGIVFDLSKGLLATLSKLLLVLSVIKRNQIYPATA